MSAVKDGVWARREALARKRDQGGNNHVETMEFAYSPSTGAVGLRCDARHPDIQPFRVFNIYYPMYGRSEEVTDWISVGVARSKPKPAVCQRYAADCCGECQSKFGDAMPCAYCGHRRDAHAKVTSGEERIPRHKDHDVRACGPWCA